MSILCAVNYVYWIRCAAVICTCNKDPHQCANSCFCWQTSAGSLFL